MPKFQLVTRIHVLSAIREYDQLGAETFLETYGFGPSRDYVLRERGKPYDSKAILGVAHRYATGTVAESHEFHGGPDGTVRWLEGLGFRVDHVDPTNPTGAKPRRTTTPRAPRAAAPARVAKPEPVIAVCPTCFMQLPNTGVCDNCA